MVGLSGVSFLLCGYFFTVFRTYKYKLFRIIINVLKLELSVLRKFIFSFDQGLQHCQQESSLQMKSKLTFLMNHCYTSQLFFSGVFLTLSASRYLIRTLKYAKYSNNMRTNKWCDCISQLPCFSSLQLVLKAPEDIYCFQFSPSDPNMIAGGCVNGQVFRSLKIKFHSSVFFSSIKIRIQRYTQHPQ